MLVDAPVAIAVPRSRLGPPRLPADLVSRPRLLRRLDEWAGMLCVVAAPAGFGKTTLLAGWATKARRGSVPGVLPDRLAAATRAALPRPTVGGHGELTPRERTVLGLLAQGRSKREIAQELGVSFNTVHSHTKAIYRKLGVSSRHEAVERASEVTLR